MSPFAFDEPATLEEALGLLDADDHTVRPFAGGTALMLMMKSAAFAPSRLVSLGRIRGDDGGFVGIRAGNDGALEIGAMTPLSTIEHSPLVRAHAPVIPRTMKRLANVRVRNVACIGGTLSHGDPHMDLPPVLASLGAEVDIVRAGDGGITTRTIAVLDLYRGYYETEIANDELIRVVRIPSQAGRAGVYVKCTTRTADDWPALGVAISVARDRGRWSGVRIVLGAVMATPTRLVDAEHELEGDDEADRRIARACEAAAAAVDPETDARGSASYKRQLVRVYVGRALRVAAAMEASR